MSAMFVVRLIACRAGEYINGLYASALTQFGWSLKRSRDVNGRPNVRRWHPDRVDRAALNARCGRAARPPPHAAHVELNIGLLKESFIVTQRRRSQPGIPISCRHRRGSRATARIKRRRTASIDKLTGSVTRVKGDMRACMAHCGAETRRGSGGHDKKLCVSDRMCRSSVLAAVADESFLIYIHKV